VSKRAVELAKVQARKSTLKHQHGAVLLDSRGRVINTGYNYALYYPEPSLDKRGHWSIHAEQAALTGLRGARVEGCAMLIVRINPRDQLRLSKPCKRCWKLLTRKGLTRVAYSDNGGNIVRERLVRVPHAVAPATPRCLPTA